MKIKYFLLFFAVLSLFAIPVSAGAVSACGMLSSSNTVYTLTQSVSSSGTCFNVTAEGITLDCNGFSVTGNNTPGTAGLYSNKPGTTVKNCNILGYDKNIYLDSNSNFNTLSNINASSSNASTYSTAIYLFSSFSNNFTNIRITSSRLYGIDLEQYSSNNIFTNINIDSNGDGVKLRSGFNNSFTNINVKSDNGRDIYLISSSTYNTFTNVNSGYSGIYLQGGCNYNTFSNINVTAHTNGIDLASSSNNSFMDTNVNSSAHGMTLDHSNGNNFTDMNITSALDGIRLSSSSDNIIANSSIRVGASAIVFFSSSSRNIIYNNTLVSNGVVFSDLVDIFRSSSGNLFYWNNFTNTLGYYVRDETGGNFYNTTINGKPAGNIWYNVVSGFILINGTAPSPFPGLYYGSSGLAYPYNSANSQRKLSGDVVDYGPLVPSASVQSAIRAKNMAELTTGFGDLALICGAVVIIALVLLLIIYLVFFRRRKQ